MIRHSLSRRRLRSVPFVLTSALVMLATSLVQAGIVMIAEPAPPPGSPFRKVSAAVTEASAAGGFTIGTGESSTMFGTFGSIVVPKVASISSSGPRGENSATATQASTTPDTAGPSIYGEGSATASVDWIHPTGGFSDNADSFFDVFFEIDSLGPEIYTLTGTVDSGGSVDPLVVFFGEVKLADAAAPALPLFLARSDSNPLTPFTPGPMAFGVPITLLPGVTYQLTARAFVNLSGGGGDGFTADAAWDFNLRPAAVPEPSSLTLMAGLGIGLVGAYRRRLRKTIGCV